MSGGRILQQWRSHLTCLIEPDAIPHRWQYALLALLATITTAIRLATIGNPPIEFTAWKEIDYLVISENYWRGGYRFLQPEISWPAEEPRVTAMELPAVPFVAAIGYALAGVTPLSARWPTLVAFVLLGIFVFFIARREIGPIAALGAAAAAFAMPLYHPFGKFLYSDPAAVCAGAASVLLLRRWLDFRRSNDAVLAAASLGIMLALKSEMVYLGLCCAWMVWHRLRWDLRAYFPALAIAAGALALALPWYLYAYWLTKNGMTVFAAFGGLFGGHDLFQTSTMLRDPGWHREIWGRLNGMIGGRIGLPLGLAGLMTLVLARTGGLVLAYLAAVVLHIVVVAEGHLDAPYRQLHAIAPLAMLVGTGAVGVVALGATLLRLPRVGPVRTPTPALLLVTLLVLCLIIAVPVRYQNQIFPPSPTNAIHEVDWMLARTIREIAGEGALIVTVGAYTIHKGGVDLSPVVYRYANARGWALIGPNWSPDVIDTLRRKGAQLLVAIDLDREPEVRAMVQDLATRYRVAYTNTDATIIDLR